MYLPLLLAIGSPAWAGKKAKKASEAPPEPVTLPCRWPEGMRFTYTAGRTRTDSRNPLPDAVVSQTPVTVTVLSTGNPTTLEWATGKPELSGPPATIAAAAELVAGLPQVPMQLVLTDGSVTGVANHAEVLAEMEPFLRQMFAGGSPEAIEQTLALFRDPQTGPVLLIREPSRFFAMHCIRMSPGETLEGAVQFPNPLGGAPIPGTSKVTLASYDAAAGTVTFETEDATDPAAITAVMSAFLDRVTPEAADPDARSKLLAELPPIGSMTRGRMVYAVADGFPISIEIRTDIGVEGAAIARSDTWTWTRTGP